MARALISMYWMMAMASYCGITFIPNFSNGPKSSSFIAIFTLVYLLHLQGQTSRPGASNAELHQHHGIVEETAIVPVSVSPTLASDIA